MESATKFSEIFQVLPFSTSAEGFRPGRHCWQLLFFLLFSMPCAAQASQPIHYVVDLTAPETHLVRVALNVPGASANT
jgi:hypothetical protein